MTPFSLFRVDTVTEEKKGDAKAPANAKIRNHDRGYPCWG
jgi:hypothetical protein